MENIYPQSLQNIPLKVPKKKRATKGDYIKAGLLSVLLAYEIAFFLWIRSEYYNNFIAQFYQ